MRAHDSMVTMVVAGLGVTVLVFVLGTCDSSLLADIREESEATRSAEITYDIIYDANGGEGSMSKQSVKYEQTVTLNPVAFTRTGYGFQGWATEPDGEVVYSNSAEYRHRVRENTTLYANWAAGQYTIFFDANEGVGSMDDRPVAFEQKVTLESNGFTRTGYDFDGWATSRVGDVVYDDEAVYTHQRERDTTLFAKWTAIEYTVTFNLNYATAPPPPWETKEVTYDSAYGTLPTPTRTGYTFGGWWTEEDGTGARITSASVLKTAADHDLYAFWYDDSAVYVVELYRAGGAGGTSSVDAIYGMPMPSASAPTKEGYRFDGYFTLPNGGGYQYYTADMESARDWDIAENTQLIANWGVYAIGDTGPAGGIVFYDKGEYTDGWRYLEAAPASTEWTIKPWGGEGTLVGGTGTAIGTGKANTQAIVTEYGDEEPRHDRADYAAKLCADLEYGGKTDWFLPSKDELNEMFENLHDKSLGGFTAVNYWSSSEDDSNHAWTQSFDNGDQAVGPKAGLSFLGVHISVRAVRAF